MLLKRGIEEDKNQEKFSYTLNPEREVVAFLFNEFSLPIPLTYKGGIRLSL